MKRVPEVIDCWFDSGAMPFAQHHYPFENQDLFAQQFPAKFISEGVDQTRGWFYSLMAERTLLFNKAPFENVIVMGHVQDENGQKIPQIDPKTGEQKIGARGRKMWQRETVEANDWNRSEKVEEWRERWADHCNKALEQAQNLERVDHRSFERQGIERIPTIHEGYVARDMEQKGQTAERCEINRDINAANIQLSALEHQQSLFTRLLEQLKDKVKEALNERLQRLRTARTADESARGNADGNRTVQADHNRPAGGSVAERLASLRSSRASGELQQGTGKNTVRVDEHEKEVFTQL